MPKVPVSESFLNKVAGIQDLQVAAKYTHFLQKQLVYNQLTLSSNSIKQLPEQIKTSMLVPQLHSVSYVFLKFSLNFLSPNILKTY